MSKQRYTNGLTKPRITWTHNLNQQIIMGWLQIHILISLQMHTSPFTKRYKVTQNFL